MISLDPYLANVHRPSMVVTDSALPSQVRIGRHWSGMIVTDPALSSQARIGRHRPCIIVTDPEWLSHPASLWQFRLISGSSWTWPNVLKASGRFDTGHWMVVQIRYHTCLKMWAWNFSISRGLSQDREGLQYLNVKVQNSYPLILMSQK